MNETIMYILSLSISGSILAVLIFALKPIIKHRLSKSIQYYIWIVVLLRLVLPFSFEKSIMNNIFYGEKSSGLINTQETAQNVNGIGNYGANLVNSPASSALTSSILSGVRENADNDGYNYDADHSRYFRDLFNQYVLYLWLFGVIIAIITNLTGYGRFLMCLKQSNKPAADEHDFILNVLLNWKNNAGSRIRNTISNNVKLMRNPFIATPMLIGILNPCIIIPDIDFEEKELESILLHEITHLRRFDISIKWLTMIATSIHWFNPLMHLIKKEINHACELSCDEAVIKNLNSAEKQAYGDTLISVVAGERKYPIGVLQATMYEEKKSLKERLIAIMNHNKKSKFVMILSGILLGFVIFSALYLGAGVEIDKDTPPNIYINTEESETKVALVGTYSWSYRDTSIQADSDHPTNFRYGADNIISSDPKQQLVISTQNLKIDRKFDFTIEQISVYKDKQVVEFASAEPSFINGNLYIQAPPDRGEYIYNLVLNYKDRGIVSYGFVVRVGVLTYKLNEISKYKTQYVGDNSKVSAIAGRLPVPDNYFKQQYISMSTGERPYGLTIYYEAVSDINYEGVWPIITTDSTIETNSRKNALVTFCMIENLDEVTFAFRNSQSDGELDATKYNTAFTFQRSLFEEEYGDLSKFSGNLALLQDILEGKKTVFKGLELYVWRKPELTGNNDLYYTLLIGTNRNKTKSEVYNFEIATRDLNIIIQELSRYSSGTDLSIQHSMDIDKTTMEKIGDELAGLLKNASMSIGGRDFDKDLEDNLPMLEFSDTEVEAARAVVEEYFRSVAAKDDEAILSTMYPRENLTIGQVKSGNVQLYGAETRTLLAIDYDSQDFKRRNYRPDNHKISDENIIVFKVSFKIEYPLKDGVKVGGPWNEGVYEDWNMILIRDNQNSPWLIYDQGY